MRAPFLVALAVALALPALAASEQPSPAPAPDPKVPYVVLRKGHAPVAVERPEIALAPAAPAERVRGLVEALFAGPRSAELASGIGSPLLPGMVLDRVSLEGATVTVAATIDAAALRALGRADGSMAVEEVHEAIVATLLQVPSVESIHVLARAAAGNDYRPLDAYLLPDPPDFMKPGEVTGPAAIGGPAGGGQGQPAGSLSGKSIFLSQSHGWLYYSSVGDWTTQRGVTNGIVEDFINAEAIDQYLYHYLWNAGAHVFVTRDLDFHRDMVIVDNDGGNGTSDYVEIGAWADSTASGFANGNAPYAQGVDPFTLGTTRVLPTSPTETGRVTFTPDIPAAGWYWVYAAYSGSGNRASDAHFIVNHHGGASHIRIDQRFDGHTWKPIGQYYFEAGKSASTGSVVIANDSTTTGSYVSADAIRFGGGMGDVIDGGTVSDHPRWEEGARAYTQYLGWNTSGTGDVTCRPMWAEWECETGEDCMYFSWHTNAPDPGTGTSSYIHDTAPTPGSVELQDAVHTELIQDLRNGWDPNWRDRGQLTANFGEVRPLTSMPGMLLELAFHDTPSDAQQLKQPKFRMLAARAIYQGMTRYYDPNATLLPEPPENLRVANAGGGSLRVDWSAAPPDAVDLGGDPATAYRVYLSTSGRGFQDGVAATGTTHTFTGLTPGQVYYVRVSATNAGGESFPTETLAARVATGSSVPMLLVNGFDRIDGSALISTNDEIGTNLRMDISRMNSFDYVIAHGESLDAAGVAFDGASNETVADGTVSLSGYDAVDWILGEESTGDTTFNAAEQAAVTAYLAAGGNLFVTGAEIGWDLVAQGNGPTFYQDQLRATYVADDAYGGSSSPTNTADGTAGGIFAGLTGIVFDGHPPVIYDVDYPDVQDPRGGAIKALDYVGGTQSSTSAAIQYAGACKVVHFGFPFEAILSSSLRDAVMSRVIVFFGITTGGATYDDVLTGAGLGDPNPNTVKVHVADGSSNPVTFDAYSAGRWGANVASGAFTGSAVSMLTGPGPGTVFGPHVRGFDRTAVPLPGLSFFAYGTLKYGVNVAAGATDTAGTDRILTGAGPGEVFGPHVRAFRYTGSAVKALPAVSFFAFSTLRYGVNVAAAELDADGLEEILAGAGPSPVFGAQCRAFNHDGSPVTAITKVNFFGWTGTGYGVNVAGGDMDDDGLHEMLLAKGPSPVLGPDVRGFAFDGTSVGLLGIDFSAYTSGLYGARVGSGDLQGDARREILTGPGRDPAASARVRAFSYDPGTNSTTALSAPDFVAYPSLGFGVNVAGADLGY